MKNKVAVVTGAAGGLGEGICLALAREGANVVVSDLSLERAEATASRISALGVKTLAVKTDVRSKDDCQRLVAESVEGMGGIDILVCCAGMGGFVSPDSRGKATLENISEDEWDLTVDINLKGVFLCNQAVSPLFKKQKSGKIINIASVGGRKGVEFIPHYSASKSGVIVFTQAIALEMAGHGVTVNSVCPGLIWTDMWERGAQVLSKDPAFEGMSLAQVFDAMVKQMIPTNKAQTPADIGNAVVFLASPEADQITGQSLNVCGGAAMN